jgi:ribosome-binding protein aMBF1 (putative translation factor)
MDYKQYLKQNKEELNLERYFDIGSLIFEARVCAGMSQEELAKKMGTRQSSIARAESGKIEPSISFLEKVAKAVGTELIYPKFKFMLEELKTR